jgi:hypothetical protein
MSRVVNVLRLTMDLPSDLFEDLMQMMVPPGDFAWRGEPLGMLLQREEYCRKKM